MIADAQIESAQRIAEAQQEHNARIAKAELEVQRLIQIDGIFRKTIAAVLSNKHLSLIGSRANRFAERNSE